MELRKPYMYYKHIFTHSGSTLAPRARSLEGGLQFVFFIFVTFQVVLVLYICTFAHFTVYSLQ